MARTTITATQSQTSWPGAGVDFPFTAADVGNKNQTLWANNIILIAYNSGASSYTATVTSVADSHGRSGDVGPKTLAAGAFAVMLDHPPAEGFQQTADGMIYYEANNAAIKFAALKTN